MISTIMLSLSFPVLLLQPQQYYVLIITCYDRRLQGSILLLKISMGTRKNFSENYQQFGHALSKRGADPGVQALTVMRNVSRATTSLQTEIRSENLTNTTPPHSVTNEKTHEIHLIGYTFPSRDSILVTS
jgi:hypothetical protein